MTVAEQEQFERDLRFKGVGYRPNGARYMMTHYGSQDQPCCERIYQGNREMILGFSGETFASLEAAILWAIADGRRVIQPNVPLSQRPFVGG